MNLLERSLVFINCDEFLTKLNHVKVSQRKHQRVKYFSKSNKIESRRYRNDINNISYYRSKVNFPVDRKRHDASVLIRYYNLSVLQKDFKIAASLVIEVQLPRKGIVKV